MADPVAAVEKIVRIGLKIKDTVDTVRHNQEECNEIRTRVLRFSAFLLQLQQTGITNNSPAMEGALEDMEESLQHALELVTACQERSTIRRLIAAGDLSKKLRRVNDNILNKVMLVSFAMSVHNSVVLFTMQAGGQPPPPRQPEDAGVVEISHSSDSTPDPRSGFDAEENNVVAGVEVPFARLLAAAAREFRWSELMAATNGFSDCSIIGEGGAFIIYKGVLEDGNVVAIKRNRQPLHFPAFGHRNYQMLVIAVSKLEHQNIVKFIGHYHYEAPSNLVTQYSRFEMGPAKEPEFTWVEEYVANGSLQEIVTRSRGRRLDWFSLFRIIEGVAQGLHYLHGQRLVHLDVKPGNILLDSDMIPKITDFNFSLLLAETVEVTEATVVGTMGYADPEYVAEGTVSTKNDVYGFGITLIEAVGSLRRHAPSREPPLDRWAWEAWEAGRIEEQFDRTLPQLGEIKRCLQIGLLCAQPRRADRPTMADVLEMLHGEREVPTPNKPGYIKSVRRRRRRR